MSDLIRRLRTACSPESPLGKLCTEAANELEILNKPFITAHDGTIVFEKCTYYESPFLLNELNNGPMSGQYYSNKEDEEDEKL